jgi:uncharacterized membrane protein YhdT
MQLYHKIILFVVTLMLLTYHTLYIINTPHLNFPFPLWTLISCITVGFMYGIVVHILWKE